jgi:hypothetical protein
MTRKFTWWYNNKKIIPKYMDMNISKISWIFSKNVLHLFHDFYLIFVNMKIIYFIFLYNHNLKRSIKISLEFI